MSEATADFPRRQHPAHFATTEFGRRAIIVFLTLCTQGRRPLLARPEIVSLMVDSWQRSKHWLVGRYVIMPDHLHLFCAPGVWPPHPLRRWTGFWQNLASRSWPHPGEKPIWQKDLWDRQLRSGESYSAKWEYVRHNPVRHRLVSDAAAWPYQGELNVLRWHDA